MQQNFTLNVGLKALGFTDEMKIRPILRQRSIDCLFDGKLMSLLSKINRKEAKEKCCFNLNYQIRRLTEELGLNQGLITWGEVLLIVEFD